MDDIHRRLLAFGTMRRFTQAEVARQLARIIGDLNFVHPFREGNGRTQLQYARLLAERAGCHLDLSRLSGPDWVAASERAMDADYHAMFGCLAQALEPPVRDR